MTTPGSISANIEKATEMVRQAAKAGADIVCLQELFNAPYPCQSEDHDRFAWAEPIPGPSSEAMSKVAKQCSVVVTGSVFERRAHGLYHNTALVFDTDGTQVGFYRKMHIPDDPHYYEKFYFTPGDTGFTVAKTKHAVLGVGVCWDQWYPEAARLFALRGAEILLYPTAIGWLAQDKPTVGKSQHEAWETMMRSHAIANGLYVAAANRVGVEASVSKRISNSGEDRSHTTPPETSCIAQATIAKSLLWSDATWISSTHNVPIGHSSATDGSMPTATLPNDGWIHEPKITRRTRLHLGR